jgi:putrescine transport system permease protein
MTPTRSSCCGIDPVSPAWRRRLILLPPALWLAAFFALPFLIVARIALSDAARAVPPFTPVFEGFDRLGEFLSGLDLDNLWIVLGDGLYTEAYLNSARLAGLATLIALLVGFPLARAIARAPERWRVLLIMLVILPFWTSLLVRIYAWIGILRGDGYLNAVLGLVGLPPLALLDTEAAVVIGLVYAYLPFVVLPIHAVLDRADPAIEEAAADLGCPPWRRLFAITIPLAMPGILAGALLMFIPAVGEFIVPDLLGGSETLMIGKTVWTEFFSNRDWPLAAMIAVLLTLLLAVPIALWQRADGSAR